MLGLDGVGKSTLLYKLKYDESVATVSTVGYNVEMLELEDPKLGLKVWDVGGQRRMRSLWSHFYAGTEALVFVVDSWDRGRLEEARRELYQVLTSPCLKKVPLVVLANKQDIPRAATPAEITLRLDLRRLCGSRDWFVQPCSATTGVGLEEGFRGVAHLMKTSLKQAEEDIKNRVKELKEKPKAFFMWRKKKVLML